MSRKEIQINLVGDAALADELDSLLLEWLGEDQSKAEIRHVPVLRSSEVLASSPDEQLLRIWVVLDNVHLARVYFAEPSAGRFLVRDVYLHQGLDELGRENVAQVLVTSAKAFIEHNAGSSVDEVVATMKSQAREPKSVAPVEPEFKPKPTLRKSAQQWFFRLGGFYGTRFETPNLVSHGPGLLAFVGRETLDTRWAAVFRTQYFWPITARASDVDISIRALALRLAFVIEKPLSVDYDVGIEAGGGLEYVSYNSSATSDSGVSAVGRTGYFEPETWLGLRLSSRQSHWRWALVPGLSTSLVRSHYDVIRQGRPQIEFAPWIMLPSCALEMTWQ
jgi:hypothetical protein